MLEIISNGNSDISGESNSGPTLLCKGSMLLRRGWGVAHCGVARGWVFGIGTGQNKLSSLSLPDLLLTVEIRFAHKYYNKIEELIL